MVNSPNSDFAKSLVAAAELEDMSHSKRGNLLVCPSTSMDILRRISENGVVIGNTASNSNPDAALTTASASSSSGGNNNNTSSLVVSQQEWSLLRDFLVRRVKSILEVITVTLRRQQDNVEGRTAEMYKNQMSYLNDFVTDNETLVSELSNWPMPMFTIQRLSEILMDPLRFHTTSSAGGDAFRNDANKEAVVSALSPVLRPEKLQTGLMRCILVAPSQINIGESCI